ncbi:MAG: ribosomal protein S18-alanine N-acetyltransferase [Deltaproteobacteria bacterium]|nr:ribosomal protein S18-alanine N-acetyltransferase [Deltaproteobacteria bacterium]
MIVPADHCDIHSIVTIERQSFPDPWSATLFQNIILHSEQKFYVFKKDQEILGYIVFWKLREEVHILNLCVAESSRRKGIGGELMNFCFSFYPPQEAIAFLLEVRKENSGAQQFYERNGFQKKLIRKNYYGQGKDAWIMVHSKR